MFRIDGIWNTEVFPIDLGFGLWKSDISNIRESEIGGIPNRRESDYGSWVDVGSCQMLDWGTGSTGVGCSRGSGLNQRLSGFIGVRTVASAHVLRLPTNSV